MKIERTREREDDKVNGIRITYGLEQTLEVRLTDNGGFETR